MEISTLLCCCAWKSPGPRSWDTGVLDLVLSLSSCVALSTVFSNLSFLGCKIRITTAASESCYEA